VVAENLLFIILVIVVVVAAAAAATTVSAIIIIIIIIISHFCAGYIQLYAIFLGYSYSLRLICSYSS
jgi:hypothetical protein